ncbi:hypothetical protein LPTSP4_36130 [Leptospira ryugenii]|uniref:Uncharacterized protein n=1 Tax=Leptospira ryugenii TaxID=1917863 RepID=A0A2P2E5B0_9LEPT|nr:hypothetical protein [Leptospira ryugenii]GBF52075.1 hypothetical protein LPTSP4_36130 [Leptospira ryugenii]
MPNNKLTKRRWLLYTVIVGLIPMFARLIAFAIFKKAQLSILLSESDIITFGLVLGISNIQEFGPQRNTNITAETIFAISILYVIFCSLMLIVSIYSIIEPNAVRPEIIQAGSAIGSISILLYTWRIYHQEEKLHD